MLAITIPDVEYYDEKLEEFKTIKGQTIQLEHSLLSISKWEAKWHISYLATENKTSEQLLDYIKCMCVSNNVKDDVFNNLSQENVNNIVKYIDDPMTATWFADDKKKSTSKEIVTSELIYYWMIALQIPVEFQKWHLNRLLTLIKVCQIKNEPPKKMNKKDLINRNRSLNAQRRAMLNSKG